MPRPFPAADNRWEEGSQNAPSPFTTFSLFYDGRLAAHEILSEKKLDRMLTEKGW